MFKIFYNINCVNMYVIYGEDLDEIFLYMYVKMDKCKIFFIINLMLWKLLLISFFINDIYFFFLGKGVGGWGELISWL